MNLLPLFHATLMALSFTNEPLPPAPPAPEPVVPQPVAPPVDPPVEPPVAPPVEPRVAPPVAPAVVAPAYRGPTVIIDGVRLTPPTGVRGGTVGNTIIVDNAGGRGGGTVVIDGNRVLAPSPAARGTTVVTNSGFGPGSRVVVDNGPAAAPAVKCYQGKDNAFWSRRLWSEDLACMIYWDPATRAWFRYHAASESYRPVASWPEAIDE